MGKMQKEVFEQEILLCYTHPNFNGTLLTKCSMFIQKSLVLGLQGLETQWFGFNFTLSCSAPILSVGVPQKPKSLLGLQSKAAHSLASAKLKTPPAPALPGFIQRSVHVLHKSGCFHRETT